MVSQVQIERLKLKKNSRIAIINRGEAALRFITALREFNIQNSSQLEAIALHIPVEDRAVFVKEADEAYDLNTFSGFAEIVGSPYLNVDFLISILKQKKCDAVWVGWGFVAEDPVFAKACEDNNILLLGPLSKPMALLGDKIKAKTVCSVADVTTTPWSGKNLDSLEEAYQMADKIGYPVILKSANGGGGRGIRKVLTKDDMAEAFVSVSDEIERFFGNRVIFMEAFVVRGRHLEVQCVADYYGNVKTFGVRDCSVQRNNQKIIEETPAIEIEQSILDEMELSSARLLKEVAYHGAGTVEFLYDLDRQEAYFMEVNTRLQVEHPITEELYQVDLVGLQIRVAHGESLENYTMHARGHVIEVRLNAEDTDKNFAPAPGYINHMYLPYLPGIRVDSGVESGCVIPTDFDSMIAKIISVGRDRNTAISRLKRALQRLHIDIDNGTTNQDFLLELLSTEDIQKGGVSTSFVANYLDAGRNNVAKYWDLSLVCASIYQYEKNYENSLEEFSSKLKRYATPRQKTELGQEVKIEFKGHKYSFLVRRVDFKTYHIYEGETRIVVKRDKWGAEDIFRVAGEKYRLQFIERATGLQVEINGVQHLVPLDSAGSIKSSSPAVVLSVAKKNGDIVSKGERILSLEAMKMEMIVEAATDGVVVNLNIKPGEQVSAGQLLCEIESVKKGGDVDAEVGERIAFDSLDSSKNETAEDHWERLANEFMSVFKGFDYWDPIAEHITEIDDFVSKHPEYLPKFMDLVIKATKAFVCMERIFKGKNAPSGDVLGGDIHDYIVQLTISEKSIEDTLPEEFVERFHEALELYSELQTKYKDRNVRSLYHMFGAYSHHQETAGLLAKALFRVSKLSSIAENRRGALAQVFKSLIEDAAVNTTILDAAVYAKYQLVDSALMNRMHVDLQKRIKLSLSQIFVNKDEADEVSKKLQEKGHELVEVACNMEVDTPQQRLTLDHILAKWFQKDREHVNTKFHNFEQFNLLELETVKRKKTFNSLFVYAKNLELSEVLIELKKFTEENDVSSHELTLILNQEIQSRDEVVKLCLDNSLKVKSLCVGLISEKEYTYTNFAHDTGKWIEDQRLKSFSSLAIREFHLDRLKHFDVELLYHHRYIHLLKLTAFDNAKDVRLFAYVEMPESPVFLGEEEIVQSISFFEHCILEAVHKMREQQVLHGRKHHWNRVIVHMEKTPRIAVDHINEYAKTISSLVEGVGLEKLVVYTNTEGRLKGRIDFEILIENLSTDHTVKGRRPADAPLVPLDPNTNKIVKSIRRKAPYPYEVIKFLTGGSELSSGTFQEYDIEVNGSDPKDQKAVAVNRPKGENESNIVFGVIKNTPFPGQQYERVLVLGDPSKDLGSLAEGECRRLIAAINLAEEKGLVIEWVPVSSGAAIDMNTGTENLDWTAVVLRKIIEFTQSGGEINIIVCAINVGAQSYWNAEATMLMHTKGVLIMAELGSMLLTGKKALDFSGSVSAEDNIGIGGSKKIMTPNGQAQFHVKTLGEAYQLLFRHYHLTMSKGTHFGVHNETRDPDVRDVCFYPYDDLLSQGFESIGDILGTEKNGERKKIFDMRQVLEAVKDQDSDKLERWKYMRHAETTIVWETQIGGYGCALIGIESQPVKRYGEIPNDGPDSWTGGTLYPASSKKMARAINAYSDKLPVVILANLSGFDGSPESLRRLQLEYGAEIGRAVVNFKGPIVFVVISRYHGGAYVVFSKKLNDNMTVAALSGTYASVIGGAPAAAVVFPREVSKRAANDPRVRQAHEKLQSGDLSQVDYDDLYQTVHLEMQASLAKEFEEIHSIERAKKVGSIDEILDPSQLRPFLTSTLKKKLVKKN